MKIDKKLLRRIFDMLKNKSRCTTSYRKNKDCNKSIFISRISKFIINKGYYKIITTNSNKKDLIHICYYKDNKKTHDAYYEIKNNYVGFIADIDFKLGHEDEIILYFKDFIRGNINIILGFNDLLDLEYKKLNKNEIKVLTKMFNF